MRYIGLLDLFKIGIGPSSSHTVGPMNAAGRFVGDLGEAGLLARCRRILVELYGSLALTGGGHGTGGAVIAGLAGAVPESVKPETIADLLATVENHRRLKLADGGTIEFEPDRDLLFHKSQLLPKHPNGLCFQAFDGDDSRLAERVYYSIGGGFVVADEEFGNGDGRDAGARDIPFPFDSGAALLALGARHNMSIAALVLANEGALRPQAETRAAAMRLWAVMQDCIARGCRREGTLPGGLRIRRRAPALLRRLEAAHNSAARDPLLVLDRVNLWAMAVNEENAGGGRVVTAPTNGAAGIIPAVLSYFVQQLEGPGKAQDGVLTFLLAATAIGSLYKKNASISGAEVGCQGEVGVACSMAAAGFAAALGATNGQIENAAEIAMEHNLGLTCDPVGGLVQVPCIERNAMGAVKAIDAVRLAMNSDGDHAVSLDRVIETMRQTGLDMASKYKETAQGGLAVNVVEC